MSLSDEVVSKVEPLAQEICEREGFLLYDVEFQAPKKTLTVYIDKKGSTVNLDDCAVFSQGLNLLLDSEDPISGQYNLEVSSPGLERLLKKNWHYEEQLGKRVKVVIKARTETAKDLGRKNLEGNLENVHDDTFTISEEQSEGDMKTFEIPYADVHRCHVVFEGKF